MDELADDLRRLGAEAGLSAVGFTTAEPFIEAEMAIEDRKLRGLSAGMQFTFRNPARSTDPRRIHEGARSIVVGAWRYRSADDEMPEDQPVGRVAAYAQVDHYADLRMALDRLADRLRDEGCTARVVIDDNALVDRAVAMRAGIGWQGKNTNILLPGEGSWFVLGAVVTDAELPAGQPMADGCRSCTRCLSGCPTGAIVAPGVLDARRCLAWLVQAPGSIPREFRGPMRDRLYGCDDCQEVCPPNRGTLPDPPQGSAIGPGRWVPLLDLLDDDDEGVLGRAGRWYIARRDPRFVRRNALVALGNVGDPDDPRIREVLERHATGDDDLLAAHAVWSAGRLGLTEIVDAATPGPLVETERAALGV